MRVKNILEDLKRMQIFQKEDIAEFEVILRNVGIDKNTRVSRVASMWNDIVSELYNQCIDRLEDTSILDSFIENIVMNTDYTLELENEVPFIYPLEEDKPSFVCEKEKTKFELKNYDWGEYKKFDETCPYTNKDVKIIVKEKATKKIQCLIRIINENEWFAYLLGKKINDYEYVVEDIFVPEQECTSVHTEVSINGRLSVINSEIRSQIVGWIHSHNNMNVFFSQEDEHNAIGHDISIVVNNAFENKAIVRLKLPCGAITKANANVDFEYEENEEFKNEIKSKIKIKNDWKKELECSKEKSESKDNSNSKLKEKKNIYDYTYFWDNDYNPNIAWC